MDLTPEQLAKAETMSLDEIRQLAVAEAAADAAPKPAAVVAETPKEQPRDGNGRFANMDGDDIDNSADAKAEEEDGKPTRTLFRKEIDNADGSGVDVYEAESLEDLVEKLAAGKANANKKIRELNQKVKTETVKTAKELEDEEYVIAEQLKTKPKEVIRNLLREAQEEQAVAIERSNEVQENFVATHPEYVTNPANSKKLVSWVRTHGYTELTTDGLEKAYQDLSKSGLLELKPQVADGATGTEEKATQRTVETPSEVTQQRSLKRSSSLSTKSRTSATPVNTGFSEDEAYKLPIEELRRRADAQLAKAGRE